MDTPTSRRVYTTLEQDQMNLQIHLLIVQLIIALNANSPEGQEEADRVAIELLEEIAKLPPQ